MHCPNAPYTNFINNATANGDLVLMIDDYTNIHAKRQPKEEETSTACTMATIFLKRFPGIPAILKSDSHINPHCISTKNPIEFAVERAIMVAKRVGTNSTILEFFFLCLPLPPYNVDLSQDMGSITWPWGTIRPTQYLIFKIQHCSGGGGYRFHLRCDLLKGSLKG